MKIVKLLLAIGIVGFFAAASGGFSVVKAEEEQEEVVEKTQDSITQLEKRLSQEEAKKAALEKNLGSIQSSLSVAQQEIATAAKKITETKALIEQKKSQLNTLDQRLGVQRSALSGLIRELYIQGDQPLLTSVLVQNNSAQAIGMLDHLETIEGKIQLVIKDIVSTRAEIGTEAEQLVSAKETHEDLLTRKQEEKQELVSDRAVVQEKIEEKEATIGELQGKLARLKSDLSDLLGKSYDASDIVEAASFAAKATGIRKDFLMGMLVVESDLGRYTGGCLAKDSRMNGRRLDLFKKIASELDYDWKKRKVSCPPKNYKGTGGAMGVAQFMSDTWMGYKSSIAALTGHNPPDPWNLTDGVSAMALKLSKVPGVKQKQRTGECNAAKLYLSGTTSSTYQWYCQKVLYWADNYERLLD